MKENTTRKEIIWLGTEIKTPPFSEQARHEAGFLLGSLQDGNSPSMPHARPMPSIGPRCLELRVRDENLNWRIVCRIDAEEIVVAGIFPKKTEKTPKREIDACKRRLALYDSTI